MEKEKEEVWKDVPGYKGAYMVSDKGRVKSVKFNKERLLKHSLSGKYLKIVSSKQGKKKTFYIHQLVAMAFLNHIPCGYELVVDHIDGNELNNNLDNLQVITNRKNTSKDRLGSSQYTGVGWHNKNKKWQAGIRIDGKLKYLGSFKDEVSASNAYQKKLKEILK
jgi:IS4 transposase